MGGRDYKTFKIEKTEFEVTFFEVKDNYDVGEKMNTKPIPVVLSETTNDRLIKVILDISAYNFRANRFYIQLKKITETTCKECYFHAPVLYKSSDGYRYIYGNLNNIYKKPDSNCVNCYGLQMIVRTLTQD